MANINVAEVEWTFTRPDPPESISQHPYFRDDLRQIAGKQDDYDLPWNNDMYLSFPSPDRPDWSKFLTHIRQLNVESDSNTFYKVIYVMRRAHKEDTEIRDPDLDSKGIAQCERLKVDLKLATDEVNLPPPEVIATSPLTRALRTTHLAIAPVFPKARRLVLEGLREQVLDDLKYQRRDRRWIEQNFANLGFDVRNVDAADLVGSTYSAKNPEPDAALWQRVKGALAHVFETCQDSQVVLLMSHCLAEREIQREVTGYDIPEIKRKETVQFYVGEARGYAIIVKGVKAV